MPYKILIVDDHPLVRDGLAMLVSSLPGGVEIFKAATAAQALEQAEFHTPLDVVLLDCGLPDADGGGLIKALQTRSGGAPVIVVSANEFDGIPERMLSLGACAFVPKSKASASILNAVKVALAHGSSASLPAPVAAQAAQAVAPQLTARQLDILLMFDQGLTNKDIALQLGLSEKTVKNHITALFQALGVVSRLQAVRQARNLKLLA
ncbi:response regulator transcription factor [Rhodoferax sp.]|uniref:response regulator transcription factor n=1 Tax=Rhodoferax sp. TaxID=50421 RepID=UPI0026054239|nr:response regulator transcription factor [Rhodoferax sp.]MDD2924456.1 response regulator transcription factor [Rhodoferax sp.]